jgi:hypothetical protein
VRDVEMGGETVTFAVEGEAVDVTGAGHLRVEREARAPLRAM